MLDDNSLNKSAFLFRNTGFFDKLRTVLITRSAIDGRLTVNFE